MYTEANRSLNKIVTQCNKLQGDVVEALGDSYQRGYQDGIKDLWRAVQRVVDRYSVEDLKKICRRYKVTDIVPNRCRDSYLHTHQTPLLSLIHKKSSGVLNCVVL